MAIRYSEITDKIWVYRSGIWLTPRFVILNHPKIPKRLSKYILNIDNLPTLDPKWLKKGSGQWQLRGTEDNMVIYGKSITGNKLAGIDENLYNFFCTLYKGKELKLVGDNPPLQYHADGNHLITVMPTYYRENDDYIYCGTKTYR